MKIKSQAILSVKAALKAVESDGDALSYVKDLDLLNKIAAKLNIEIETE